VSSAEVRTGNPARRGRELGEGGALARPEWPPGDALSVALIQRS
jgi:hypothetical protein